MHFTETNDGQNCKKTAVSAENKAAAAAADVHEANAAPSDIDDDAPAVDTDQASIAESGDTTGSAPSTDNDSEVAATSSRKLPKLVPAIGGKPQPMSAIGGKPTMRRPAIGGGSRVFDNGIFHAVQQHREKLPHIHMYINATWIVDPPFGIGKTPTMSKSITMAHVGDTEQDPLCTMILLRAWMVWRVRQHPAWLASDCHRQRLFTEEVDQLVADVRRMQPQKD